MHHSDYMEDFNNAMGRPNSIMGFGGFKPVGEDKTVLFPKGKYINDGLLKQPESEVTVTEPVAEKNYQATMVGARIGSSLGFIVALGYAFKVKSGFWKGWGYTILGSMALGGLGAGVGLAIDSSKNKNN